MRKSESRPLFLKHAKIWFVLLVLLELGLKRLRYSQIRGFLKTVGVHQVLTDAALERYAQRLGLKGPGMKTNKHQTLLLVKVKQTVRAKDLMQAFGYSAPTARSYLS